MQDQRKLDEVMKEQDELEDETIDPELLLEWVSPEHHFDKRHKEWYWFFGIICAAIVFLAFYFDNPTFGFFTIIASIMLGIISYRETRSMRVQLTERGIVLGERLHKWTSFRSFWIEDEHMHGDRIILSPVRSLATLEFVHINEEIDLNLVREILLEFLEEEYLEDTYIHKMFDKVLGM